MKRWSLERRVCYVCGPRWGWTWRRTGCTHPGKPQPQWASPAAQQVKWARDYITTRYGGVEESPGWYERGGRL